VLATTTERIARLRAALESEGADAALLPPSADFRWLTGAVARSTERLVVLAVPRAGEPFCVVPRLESEALAHACPDLELEIWDESEDPFERLERRLSLASKPALLVGEGWRTPTLLRLAERARCRPAQTAMGPLRACKDAAEIAALDRAAAHADQVVEETGDALRPGLTEIALARQAMQRFEELGDHDAWAIVASGPNSALPHHHPGDRVIADGDVVIVDCGAFTDGYGSDITRTYFVGAYPAGATAVYAIVNQARAAGIAAARPGVACEDVDAAARGVIDAQGFGAQFIHRTGHGVGLEVHEPPYLVAGNRAPLLENMVHSVEPGIYRSGAYGIRLEDLVVIESGGARRLNRAPFDFRPRSRR
jgi:Xaa-Pro dipeptidase